MGVASSLGLISGINYEELVSKLISLERNPITLLENRKTDIQGKVGALDGLNVKLASLKSVADTLNTVSMFNTRTVKVNGSATDASLTASASSSSSLGTYTIYVDQLAQSHKIASQGWVDENSTAILDSTTYPSGGNFSFRIGSSGAITDIQITDTTTLQELKDMINAADAGLTATILRDGTKSNPYRLVLNSDTMGANNTIQITTNVTHLDFTNKLIEEATADTTNSGTYIGSVNSNTSEYYTGTNNKTYIIQTTTAGTVGAAGTARYRYSTDGGISWTDNGGSGFSFYTAALTNVGSTDGTNTTGNSENVKVQFSDSGTMSLGDTFRVDVFNPTFNEAKDAVIRVDSLTLIKHSNTISDVIDGVTLNLVTADATNPNTLTVSRGDFESAKSNIEEFVSSYNVVMEELYNTFYYDPDNPSNNTLRGDHTVRGIQMNLKQIALTSIPGLTGDFTSLYQIGISVDTTGRLSIDDYKLSSALATNPLAVMMLFVDFGTPTDNSIEYESKTSATKAGKYSIYISTSAEKASFDGDESIGSGGITENETLIFTYTNEASEEVPTVTSFTANLSAGDTISTIVSKLNSKFASEEVGLSASNNGGKLKITSSDHGSDIKFTVVSDKGSTQTDTQTFYVGSGDGYASYKDKDWDKAHDDDQGEGDDDGADTVDIFQSRSGDDYNIRRGFFPIDTSSLPDDVTITSAIFNFYVEEAYAAGAVPSYRLVQTTQTSPTEVKKEDYDQAGAVNNPIAGAADLAIDQDETGWKAFDLNATGLGWISKTGYTQLGIRGQTYDGADVPPFGSADIVVRASEYGGTTYDPYLEVSYIVDSGIVQTGIGTDLVTVTGTDVEGTINGHVALGKGKYLTGITGFDEAGLMISTTTTTAGGKGHVNVSTGIAAQLNTKLDYITNPYKGTIAYRNDAFQSMIDDIDQQIERKEVRITEMEERLRKEYVNLEVLLSSMQAQADYLKTMLSGLPSLYMATNNT